MLEGLEVPKVHVIPATPGTYTMVNDNGELKLGCAVIAWRIDSYYDLDSERFVSSTYPITVYGDDYHCLGITQPNGAVVLFELGIFENFYAAEFEFKKAYFGRNSDD